MGRRAVPAYRPARETVAPARLALGRRGAEGNFLSARGEGAGREVCKQCGGLRVERQQWLRTLASKHNLRLHFGAAKGERS
jgi:hypothetical protein